MDIQLECRKVSIQPIELLKLAKEMLGDQYWLFVGITFLGILIGSAAPMGILMGPMLCGIYLCYIDREGGQPASFDRLFKGFEFFTESLIATLVMVGVSLVVMIPVGLLFFVLFIAVMAGTDGDGAPIMLLLMPFAYLIVLVVMIVVSTPFLFVYPLIAERGLKAMPAIKTSWQGVKTNLGGLIQLVLLYTLISCIGSCLCYVPGIMFLPLSFGGIFLVYREVFPLEGKGAAPPVKDMPVGDAG